MKIRLKHKKITFLIIFLVLPIATIVSVNANDTTEIDFLIYLRNDDSQILVDELIVKAESLGLSVNAMYVTWDEWCLLSDIGAYDISYGGIQIAYNIDTIFNLVYSAIGLDWMVLKHDDAKLTELINQLLNYYFAAQTTPMEDIPALIDDMIDKFQDVEERLWEKQLIFPLAQWLNPMFACNDALYINSKAGHVFADENLRFSYSSIIDRSLFVDYWSTHVPFTVSGTYHMFGWSSYHNFELPNCLPI
jgi:hypothetical protein